MQIFVFILFSLKQYLHLPAISAFKYFIFIIVIYGLYLANTDIASIAI